MHFGGKRYVLSSYIDLILDVHRGEEGRPAPIWPHPPFSPVRVTGVVSPPKRKMGVSNAL